MAFDKSKTTHTGGWTRYARALYVVCVALVILFALAVRINVAVKHRVPQGDEGAWLRLAARAFSAEFMTSRIIEHDLYFERTIPHPEDNRSPLYPLLIALFRVIIKDPFSAGQALNLCVSLLFLIITALGLRRSFGSAASLAGLVFCAVSPFLITFSAQVYPDLLIALGFFLILYKSESIAGSLRGSLCGGIGLGLLFLLKTTALCVIPVVIGAYVRRRRDKDIIQRAGCCAAPLILLSLPWLIRNQLAFGSPLFQVATYTMYMERWSDFFNTDLALPTLSAYVAEYGVVHVLLWRPVAGFAAMARLFPHFDHTLSLALVPLCLAGIFSLNGKKGLLMPVVWFSIFYLPLMAYLAYNSWVARYTMVYYVLLYCLAAAGVGLLWAKIKKLPLRIGVCVAVIALPLFTVAYPLEFYLSPRGSEREQDRINREMVTRVVSAVPRHAVVLSPFLSQYSFMHDLSVVNALNFKNSDELRRYIDLYAIGYVLLDADRQNRIGDMLLSSDSGIALTGVLKHGALALYATQNEKRESPEYE